MTDSQILYSNKRGSLPADRLSTGAGKGGDCQHKNTRCILALKNVLKNYQDVQPYCQDVNTDCKAKKEDLALS